ncbi:hypothetical protein [Arcticibacter sp. MXS-1]|uniref:hypothetical protein n=1 Tax=Arcticibacter sp. MXS-1 TaxID=3341726 RepID=UPI0035A996BE
MILFETTPELQEDLRVDSLRNLKTGPPEEPNEDDDLSYDDDDLGENTEVTPLGDDIDEDDLNAMRTSGPLDDEEDDLLTDEDELDVDTDQYADDDDEIVDITTSSQNDPDDDELYDDDDDDDDLLMDDDVGVADDDEEAAWEDDDDEDLLNDDEDLDTSRATTATDAPQMLDTDDSGVSSRREVRKTGRMIGHEPGIPGGPGSEI